MIIKLYEKFITEAAASDDIDEVKDIILIKAIDTEIVEIVEFFVNKGYNINGEQVLFTASFDDNMFRYFLENGADVKKLLEDDVYFDKRIKDVNVQKALIDFGHEQLIYDGPGFNDKLKNDPKYADIIERFENAEKYNL